MMVASLEAARYLEPSARGWCALLYPDRQGGNKQDFYRLPQIPSVLDALTPDPVAYLSQQAFYKPSRCLVHLQRLGVCFVDLETYKSDLYKNMTPEQQAMALRLYCETNAIPCPTLINSSGRGLHVKWCLARPLPRQALPRWNAVQKELIDRLRSFCPDRGARDGSRCLRIVGSVNPRSGQQCRTLWIDGPNWDFEDFAFELLPFTREELQAKHKAIREVKTNGTVANLWSQQQIWWCRYHDILKLIDVRGWHDGVPVGHRNNFVFIAACAISYSAEPENLEPEIVAFAADYCPSLPAHEALSSCGSVIRLAKKGTPYGSVKGFPPSG